MTTAIKKRVQQSKSSIAINEIASSSTDSQIQMVSTVQASNDLSVVLPDTSTKKATVTTIGDVDVESFDASFKRYNSMFESLINRRAKYDALLNKHSDYLYGILSDCLALCLDSQRNDPKSALRESLNAYREAKKATRKIQDNTPFETVIVRFVFEESTSSYSESISRSQASVYSIVIRKAIDANVAPSEFTTWVKKNGGLEKIRREREENEAKKANSLAAKTKGHFKNASVITEINDKKLNSSGSLEVDTHVVLIGRRLASGKIGIVEIINDNDIVNILTKTFVKSLD